MSKTNTPKAATPKAATPKAATPKAATPKAATPKADAKPAGKKAKAAEPVAVWLRPDQTKPAAAAHPLPMTPTLLAARKPTGDTSADAWLANAQAGAKFSFADAALTPADAAALFTSADYADSARSVVIASGAAGATDGFSWFACTCLPAAHLDALRKAVSADVIATADSKRTVNRAAALILEAAKRQSAGGELKYLGAWTCDGVFAYAYRSQLGTVILVPACTWRLALTVGKPVGLRMSDRTGFACWCDKSGKPVVMTRCYDADDAETAVIAAK